MNKLILYIIFTIAIALPVIAPLEICEDTPSIQTNCAMVTPSITCDNYIYNIYNITGVMIETGSLTKVNESTDIYYFNFTQSEGKYILQLCDGATREVDVNADTERYWIYILVAFFFLALLAIGYITEAWAYPVLAGMLIMVTAIDIFFNGFPNLTNEFIRNGIVIVLAGVGMYFMIAPIVDYLGEQ